MSNEDKTKTAMHTAMVKAVGGANTDGRFNDWILENALKDRETPTEYTKRLGKETRDKSAGFTK